MKAAVLRGVKDLRLEDLPVPEVGPGEALVKITVSGVCGTDAHMYGGTNFEGKFPFVPGHEWVGRVVEVGPGVTTHKVGDRVTGECFIPCRSCPICLDGHDMAFCPNHRYYGFAWGTPGGMAEYHCSPVERLIKVPANLTDEEAAMVEPVSVAYHAIWRRGGGVAPHDRVGIIGAGPIGLFAMQIAQVAAAQVIVVEPQPFRQELARKMGADEIVDPSQEGFRQRILDLTDGLGLTLVMECSGSKAGIASTVDIVAVDGRIVLTGQSMGLAVPIEVWKTNWNHAKIIGANGSPHFFPKTMAYISRHRADITPIITHRLPLARVQEAFDMALRATESGKILLNVGE
jgi:L-iditol 2-dehydrogenase